MLMRYLLARVAKFLDGDASVPPARDGTATQNNGTINDPVLVSKIRAKFHDIDVQLTDLWESIEKHQAQIRKYQLRIANDTYNNVRNVRNVCNDQAVASVALQKAKLVKGISLSSTQDAVSTRTW